MCVCVFVCGCTYMCVYVRVCVCMFENGRVLARHPICQSENLWFVLRLGERG